MLTFVATVAGVDRRVARDPGRRHAVEGVGPVLDRGEEVVGLGDPEQVSGLVRGQLAGAPTDDRPEQALFQRSPDPVAVEPTTFRIPAGQGLQIAAGQAPQVLVVRALDHPEERLVRPVSPLDAELVVRVQTALRPAGGPSQRVLLVGAVVQQGGALVEGEDHVGAQLVLDLHRHLRGEAVRVTVEVRGERDPLFVDHGESRSDLATGCFDLLGVVLGSSR